MTHETEQEGGPPSTTYALLLDPVAGKGALHPDRIEKCAEVVGRYVDGASRALGAPERLERDEMAAMEWSQTTWALSAATLFYAECAARGRG